MDKPTQTIRAIIEIKNREKLSFEEATRFYYYALVEKQEKVIEAALQLFNSLAKDTLRTDECCYVTEVEPVDNLRAALAEYKQGKSR